MNDPPDMKVEVCRNGQHLITQHLDKWSDFGRYLLQWLTSSMIINIRFQGLKEMAQLYTKMFWKWLNVFSSQDQCGFNCGCRWDVTIIHPFGKVLDRENVIQVESA